MTAAAIKPPDRRRKLTDADRAEIRELAARGWTQTRIAVAFGVSGPAVGNVLHPERAERQRARLAERGGHYALYGKAWQPYMRRWRAERQRLLRRIAKRMTKKGGDMTKKGGTK